MQQLEVQKDADAGDDELDKEGAVSDEQMHEALESHAATLRGMNPNLTAEQSISQAAQERPELVTGYRRHAQRKAQALGRRS